MRQPQISLIAGLFSVSVGIGQTAFAAAFQHGGSGYVAPTAPPPAIQTTVTPDPSATTQAVVQDQPVKATAADPVVGSKDRFVGKLPAVPNTFSYPPGNDQSTFESYHLALGDDGYYRPTEQRNWFLMRFPPSAVGMPVSLTCSAKSPTRALGTLSWTYLGGTDSGGGVALPFPQGEGEAHYQTNFTNGDSSLVMMMVELPAGTGVKECRVSGTFEQPSR